MNEITLLKHHVSIHYEAIVWNYSVRMRIYKQLILNILFW